MFDAEVFVPCDAQVGEGPVVEEAAGRLVFVDIPRGRLLRADLREPGPATEIARVGMTRREGSGRAVPKRPSSRVAERCTAGTRSGACAPSP